MSIDILPSFQRSLVDGYAGDQFYEWQDMPYFEHRPTKRQRVELSGLDQSALREAMLPIEYSSSVHCHFPYDPDGNMHGALHQIDLGVPPIHCQTPTMSSPQHAYPSPQSSCASMPAYPDHFARVGSLDESAWLSPYSPCGLAFAAPDLAAMPTSAASILHEPEMFHTGDSALLATSEDMTRHRNEGHDNVRSHRATSISSTGSSMHHCLRSDSSRSASPHHPEMSRWGFKNAKGTWSCAYPGCTSRSTFSRGCDLRKHYKRHTKSLFCRHQGCPQASEGGFSSKKDRARHEAKHNPSICCVWDGCGRMFSRVDNMKDHVRRVHKTKHAA